MKIVVFIKEVPDTEANIKVNADKNGIVEDGIEWIVNPYDEFAIEEALALKETLGDDSTVTAIACGTTRVETVLKADVLARGVDEAYLVTDDGIAPDNALAMGKALAKAAEKVGYDIIFAGRTGIDYDFAAEPVVAAQTLNIPYVASIITFAHEGGKVTVTREIDGGDETVVCDTPCLLTCQKGLNEPRYPSLKGKMKAKKKKINALTLADIGLSSDDIAQGFEVVSCEPPAARAEGKVLEGDDAQVLAAELVKLLREEAKAI